MAEENIAELYVELGVVQEVDNVQEIGTVQEQELDNADNLQEIGIGQELDNVDDVQEIGIVQELDNADVHEDSHPAEDENAYAPGDEREAELHSSEVELDKSAVVEEKKWPGWPGENVFRILIPVQKVGGIIGRKGEFIKKMCEETRARIKILDGPPGITERAVLISAKEDPNLTIPPALDGLLTIHKRIIDPDSDPSNPQSGGTVCTKLLVAASQAGSLIGKQGGTVKTIQDDSHCTIRVLGGENLPVFALPDDSIVEVQGEPAGVIKAVELIASHLRKFLVDRSVVAVFEMQMQMANARGNQDSPRQSWGPPPPFPMNPAGHGYESNRPFMPHNQRPYDNYYPPGDMPMEKPPRSGPPTYGRGMSGGAHTTNVQPQQAVIAKVTQNMQIPLSYADAVIGLNGANISYIRRASGATIAIQETRGVPDEMTVEIDGSATEVQTAQQLIQNSIAEAVNSQNPSSRPPSQGYNPYPSQGTGYASQGTGYASHGTGYASQPSHGTGYTSQPSNAAGQGAHPPPPGDYGSMYGGNYGY